jgi:hypothetical protein
MTTLSKIQMLSPIKRGLFPPIPSRKGGRLPKAAWRVRPKAALLCGTRPHWYRYHTGSLTEKRKKEQKVSLGNVFSDSDSDSDSCPGGSN